VSILQISKIQVRRGKQEEVPQLASGEFGWAIDEQRLYIGNGAVAEGAPYVGNTELLTEHSNIIDFVSSYQYTGNELHYEPNIITGVPAIFRSLQQRLDEHITVKAFGVSSNSENYSQTTVRLQRAIDQLYLKNITDERKRLVLEIPAGVYTINEPLRIPANTTLKGAGKNKTVIIQIGDCEVFYTVTSDSRPRSETDPEGVYIPANDGRTSSVNRPKNIHISDLTFKNTRVNKEIGILYSTSESTFENVRFEGTWKDIIQNVEQREERINEFGLRLESINDLIASSNNLFESCDFVKMSYAVVGFTNVFLNTFNNCKVIDCLVGINWRGSKNNTVSNSMFNLIDRQGLLVNSGTGNVSTHNKFLNVGNVDSTTSIGKCAVVEFQQAGNVSELDYFQRAVDYGDPNINLKYIGEYAGHVIGNHKFNKQVTITGTAQTLFQLSAFNDSINYTVEYVYQSSSVICAGTLHITYNDGSVQLTNEYNIDVTNLFNITVDIIDINDTGTNQLLIKCTNAVVSSTFSYWYSVIS
jgi:hypothetical protein